jgi:hypothetical protein
MVVGHRVLGDEPSRLFALTTEARDSGFARGDVVSLLHGGVLRRSVEVAHMSLQRRAFIDRAAAC